MGSTPDKKCKICNLPEQLRETIQDHSRRGISHDEICYQLPELKLNRQNIIDHMDHLDKINPEKLRVSEFKKKIEAAFKNKDTDFFKTLEPELKQVILGSVWMTQRAFEDDNFRQAKECIGMTETALRCLNMITSFSTKNNLDVAMETVLRAGYKITDNDRSQKRILERQDETLDKMTFADFENYKDKVIKDVTQEQE